MSARAVFIVALLTAAPLDAMSIRATFEFLAWSDDAKAAAFSEKLDGPEGGGSISLVVAEFATGKKTRYTFGSNFSPGGSTHPQTISARDCAEALKQAREELARVHITAVKLNDATCKSLEGRYAPVAAMSPGEPTVWIPTAAKPDLALEKAKLTWTAGTTTASSDAATIEVMRFATDTPYFHVFRAPGDAAVCVTAGSDWFEPVVVFRIQNALKTLRLGY